MSGQGNGVRTPRYLRYEGVRLPTGMNHQLTNLKWLMREAFECGRLALLPDLVLGAGHNLGSKAGCGTWDKYFDFGRSRLLGHDGSRHPLPLVRALPRRALCTVTLGPGMRLPASAERAELVVRRVAGYIHARGIPGNNLRRLLGEVADGSGGIGFDMRPSTRVRALAAAVVADLGSRYGEFAAVHVRRRDRLSQSVVRRRTEPDAIGRRLAALGVRDGATVYFLSDERDPEYWRPLQRRYRVVRYVDYAGLVGLISPDDGSAPDNYLLYEVEKAIMRRACVRVETIPSPGVEPADGTLVSRWEWWWFRLRRFRGLFRIKGSRTKTSR